MWKEEKIWRTLWFVRWTWPELLDLENRSEPAVELTGCRDILVRGGDVYMTLSCGRRTNPSVSWSITQLLGRRIFSTDFFGFRVVILGCRRHVGGGHLTAAQSAIGDDIAGERRQSERQRKGDRARKRCELR